MARYLLLRLIGIVGVLWLSGIVTFNIPGRGAAELSASLLAHERILASTLEANSGSLRISTHVFNNDEEIDRLVTGLQRIQKSGY